VTRVSGELPLAEPRVLDPAQHLVQGLPQPGDLALRPTQLEPAGEVPRVESPGLRGEFGHGCEPTPCDEPPGQPGEQPRAGGQGAGPPEEGCLALHDAVHLDGQHLDLVVVARQGSGENALGLVAVVGVCEEDIAAQHGACLRGGEERCAQVVVGGIDEGPRRLEQLRLDLRGLHSAELAFVDLGQGQLPIVDLHQGIDQCPIEFVAQCLPESPVREPDEKGQDHEEHRGEGGAQPHAQG
jgi:hypothetical protein